MKHQEPNPSIQHQGAEQPFVEPGKPRKRGESGRAVAPRKRDRDTSGAPALTSWVESKLRNDFPEASSVSKSVDIVALRAVAVGTSTEINLRIEKSYKVRIEKTAGQTRVTGELHLVPWDRYKDVIDGLITAIASLLNLQREKILKESDIPALPNGTANPEFRLTLPRLITDDEQRALDVAYTSFNQRMRGQEESLTKDLFATANPEAVNAGQRAAEGVRRKSGGRSLPQPLTVTSNDSNAKPVTFSGRIGNHPDAERDEDPIPMTGRVVTTKTEDHQFEIRSFDFRDKKGNRVKNSKGKKFAINYSDKDHRAAVLKLPLGLHHVVHITVIPRVGRNKDKWMLKSIDDVQPPAIAADRSSTMP